MSLGPVENLLETIDLGLRGLSASNVGAVLKAIDGFQQEPLVLIHRGVLTKYIQLLCHGFFELDLEEKETLLARSQVFYTLSKIVTWKRIVRYLPTDVYLLQRLIPLLESGLENWYLQYFVLSWVYVLCLSPFKLEIADRIYDLVAKYKETPSVAPVVVDIQAQLLVKDKSFFNSVKDGLDLSTGIRVVKLCLNREVPVVDKQTLDRFTAMCLAGESDPARLKMLPKLFRMHTFYEDTDSLQEIVAWILARLSNEFTETRFVLAHSYAKIVRAMITELDDKETAQELIELCLQSTVQLFEEVSWEVLDRDLLHTYLLIIAELSPTIARNFPHCILQISEQIVPYACRFQQLKMNTIQGSQVRDASNFICWSLARANINRERISSKSMTDVFLNVLMCSTFDRELLVRKSANAALQEILGRFVTFSGLLSNSAILQIIELPITNLQENFASNVIQLYTMFIGNGRPEFARFMIHWLFDYCVMSNHDLGIIQLTTEALCCLVAEEPSAVQTMGLADRIDLLTPSTTLDVAKFLYLLANLESRGLICALNRMQPSFQQVADSMNGKRFTKNHYELFKYVAVLEYLGLVLKKSEKFSLSRNHVDLIIHIIRSFSETMFFFKDIVRLLKMALSIISTDPTKFESVALQAHFWTQFEGLICSNKSVACSAFSAVEPHLFVRMLHTNLPLMDCLRKSQMLDGVTASLLRHIVDCAGSKILFIVAKLLNDYTITEQGDVGRLVRTSSSKLIQSCQDLFFKEELTELVTSNLIRLCGEPSEEMRRICFATLQQRKGVNKFEKQDSFPQLLAFQRLHFSNHSKQFWRGYLISAGAIHSTELQIRTAIDSFLKYYYSLPLHSEQLELCNDLVRIIPSAKMITDGKQQVKFDIATGCANPDIIKITVTYLKFWQRVMESGIKIDKRFNFEGFYAKLYNLHLLNGASLLRVTILGLFPHLAICHTRSNGTPEKNFINPIIKRLFTIARREAQRNETVPSLLQQECIKNLAAIFLELEFSTQLQHIVECGDRNEKLLFLSESDILIE